MDWYYQSDVLICAMHICKTTYSGIFHEIVTLDSLLIEKYAAGIISREDTVNKSQDPTTMIQKLVEWEAEQPESTPDQPELVT